MSHTSESPEISQEWIYIMIFCGWVGVVIHLLIFAHSIYSNRQKKKTKLSNIQRLLNFTIWICNLIACLEWGTLRTSIFLDLTVPRCKLNYISNYLFYMMGKYTLHILLFYRLYFIFRTTNVRFKERYVYLICAVITINFIIFTGLWFDAAMDHVTVGVLVPNRSIEVCTMFNNSKETVHAIDRVWPILLGGQDLIVGLFTLALFVYKMTQFHRDKTASFYELHKTRIEQTTTVMRKLLVLGAISIASTSIFYTFAIPFYGNLTFLLPLDATINSLCTVLLFNYSSHVYKVLCCPCDGCLSLLFRTPHQTIGASKELERYSVPENTHTQTVNDYQLHQTPKVHHDQVTIKTDPDSKHDKAVLPAYIPTIQGDNSHSRHSLILDKPLHLADSRQTRSSFF
eukprot:856960_1